MRRERESAARPAEVAGDAAALAIRREVDGEDGFAARRDLVAQGRGMDVDRAALDAASRDDEIAAVMALRRARHDRLDRLSGETLGEMTAPGDVEPAIRRTQRPDLDAAPAQPGNPGAIRAEERPARAAARQDDRIR